MKLGLRLGFTGGANTAGGGPTDTTAPVLSSPTGVKTGSTTGTIGATTDESNGVLYGVVTTSTTAPSKAQVKAGQNNGGTSAVFAGSTSVSATGAVTINATGLSASTTYYAHLMHEDVAGNQSNVASYTTGFTTDAASDTTAPTLSSPVGTKTGSTTATIGATTDEANGTMYGVVTTSFTAPTATQVKAGQNNGGTAAVFAGSTSVSSTGAKTISATGLSAATLYYAHIMHEDAAGNKSSVVSSSSFTTDASGSWQPSDSSASLVFIASTSSCFTDTAGTTPVSADGDQVKCIKDTGGTRIIWDSNGPNWPVYRTNSGKPYLDCSAGKNFQGSGINTQYGLTDGSGNATCGVALRTLSTSHQENFLEGGHVWSRVSSAGGNLSCFCNHSGGQTGDNAGVAMTVNGDFRTITKVSGPSSVEIIVNNTTNGANTAGGTLTAYTNERIAWISNPSYTSGGSRIYRFAFFPSVLDSTNTSNLDTWLQAGF